MKKGDLVKIRMASGGPRDSLAVVIGPPCSYKTVIVLLAGGVLQTYHKDDLEVISAAR
jgi:hypothetical protein